MNYVWVLTSSNKSTPYLEKIIAVYTDYNAASAGADFIVKEETYRDERWKNLASTSDLVRFASDEGILISLKRFPLNMLPDQRAYSASSGSSVSYGVHGRISSQEESSGFPQMSGSSSSGFPSTSGVQTPPGFPQMSGSSSSGFPQMSGVQTPPGFSSNNAFNMPHMRF